MLVEPDVQCGDEMQGPGWQSERMSGITVRPEVRGGRRTLSPGWQLDPVLRGGGQTRGPGWWSDPSGIQLPIWMSEAFLVDFDSCL